MKQAGRTRMLPRMVVLGCLATAVALVLHGASSTPALANTDWLLENDAVRAVLNTYAPGDLSGNLEHPFPRFVYVIDGGTLESIDPSGTSMRTLDDMTCQYAPPASHSVRNVGDGTVRVLEVELKGARGPGETARACATPEETSGRKKRKRPPPTRRTVLLDDPDLLASRIEILAGDKERRSLARGSRFIYVVSGGPLESEQPNGKKAVATETAALWVGRNAVLVNRGDVRSLVLIEIEPRAAR